MPIQTVAVPHDMLKPVNWRGHDKKRYVDDLNIVNKIKSLYFVDWGHDQGLREYVTKRSLYDVIIGHSGTRSWERYWAEADRVASAVGRFRLRKTYWRSEQDSFIVKVYDRNRTFIHKYPITGGQALEHLRNILDRGQDPFRIFKEINDFLTLFPSDSRFPFIGLKAHHWMVDALRRSRSLRERARRKLNLDMIFVIRVHTAAPRIYRLKDLRSHRALNNRVLKYLEERALNEKNLLPLRVGDDIFFVGASNDELNELLYWIHEQSSNLGITMEASVYQWTLYKRPVEVEPGKRRPYYLIDSYSKELRLLGVPEVPRLAPPRARGWPEALEEGKVMWIHLSPEGGIEEAARRFLDNAEKLLEEADIKGVPVPERVENPTDLSPDLLISLAEGLESFYTDCAKELAGNRRPEDVVVIGSLEETILLKGLKDGREPISLFKRICSLAEKCLCPINVIGLIADGRYPFWRIYELLTDISNKDSLIYVQGGRVLRISSVDVELLERASRSLRGVSRSQFQKIIREARKVDGPRALAFFIKQLAEDGKLGNNGHRVANELIRLIEDLYRRHKDMEVIHEALKLLKPFTRIRAGRGEEVEYLPI